MRQVGALLSVIMSTALLAGCGGGGGGGTSSVSLVQDWLGTDPNAIVTTSSGTVYNLKHGPSDPAGSTYAANFNNASSTFTYSSSFERFGAVVSNTSANCISASANVAGCGITIAAPHTDVLAAWKQGWTGKDTNILIVDSFGSTLDNDLTHLEPHGAIVAAIAERYAIGATVYGRSWYVPKVGYFDMTGATVNFATLTQMTVVNASFGYSLQNKIGRPNDTTPWTTAELEGARQYYLPSTQIDKNWLAFGDPTSPGGTPNVFVSDAVITKAAGNEKIDAQYEALNYALANDPAVVGRLLIVGALTGTGYVDNKVSIASNYSNVAGPNLTIQNRFLLASGKLPFDPTTVSYDGRQLDNTVGTSYAAPRIAGYVAIIRQKFPNLTAANTADILLQTARYDTLTCYPNCDKAIYGQGEASLSHALSPYGKLR